MVDRQAHNLEGAGSTPASALVNLDPISGQIVVSLAGLGAAAGEDDLYGYATGAFTATATSTARGMEVNN